MNTKNPPGTDLGYPSSIVVGTREHTHARARGGRPRGLSGVVYRRRSHSTGTAHWSVSIAGSEERRENFCLDFLVHGLFLRGLILLSVCRSGCLVSSQMKIHQIRQQNLFSSAPSESQNSHTDKSLPIRFPSTSFHSLVIFRRIPRNKLLFYQDPPINHCIPASQFVKTPKNWFRHHSRKHYSRSTTTHQRRRAHQSILFRRSPVRKFPATKIATRL